MKRDIVIIGGGASGLTAAILIKRQNPLVSVMVLEALDRVCKKLIVTGNGRCNITNKNLDFSFYHGENSEFCHFALKEFGYNFTVDFFESIGIPLVDGENGKMYPYSLQAASVVDALRLETQRLGVETIVSSRITDIKLSDSGYILKSVNNEFLSKKIIIASGGIAGGIKLGSMGDGYKLLSLLGYKTVSQMPSIVQLKTDLTNIKALNGIKVNARVSAIIDHKKVGENCDELLFTKYGVSGPAVMQISRHFNFGRDKKIKINFMPEFTYNEIFHLLLKRKNILKDRTMEFFFTGLLPKMLGFTMLKMCNISLNQKVSELNDNVFRYISENIFGFTISVTAHNGFENAQVTAGGISTEQFDNKTMESKIHKGLYAIGEVLDIDGDCGGYNLQWAWSSAAAAAKGITDDTDK
ncbi:MAG: aminoacetone oxidase family FAD-binding enzyme [Ruminococcaceae bacterium]|nr:aminoacetone oxidase family FAD-binding enzyme [Oscillospiraceae bacterium]